MKYEMEVDIFLKNVKDKRVKDEVIDLYLYLNRGFANDLALVQRDYELGLCNDVKKRDILTKSYNCENKLRSYLGLEPLPEIDLTIL